jgi:hypothetical protein
MTPGPREAVVAEDPGLIPLVVGVTGHREIRDEDRDALTKSLRKLFRHLTAWSPARPFPFPPSRHVRLSRSPTPLLLLTPLAEGADRLVASVAIEFGAKLVVPLPLPRQEYEKDFAPPGRSPDVNARSLAEFSELISREHTVRVIDLPQVPASAGGHHTLDEHTRRNLQYALVGAYVARQAQVLIALWDGHPPQEDKPGGTADIVAFRRTGRFSALPDALVAHLAQVPEPFRVYDSPLDPPDTGAVHHLVTPRKDRDLPTVLRPFGEHLLAPAEYDHHAHARRRYFGQLARIERQIHTFNHEALAARDQSATGIAESAQSLYPAADSLATSPDPSVAQPPAHSHAPLGALSEPLARLRRAFALADTLAIQYQRRTYRALKWVLWLGFVAVLMFEMYAELYQGIGNSEGDRLLGLMKYVLFLGLADWVYVWVRAHDIQNRFQDYRALAEGLRVQFYWRLAGLGHAASDYYLRKQRDELTWIRNAIRSWGLTTSPPGHADAHAADHLWVGAQHRYYLTRARPRDLAELARFRERGSGLIGASIAAAGAWCVAAAWHRLLPICTRCHLSQVDIMPFPVWLLLWLIPALAGLTFAWHLFFRVEDEADDYEPTADSLVWTLGTRWALAGFALGALAIGALSIGGPLVARRTAARLPDSGLLAWLHFAAAPHPWFVTSLVLTALAGTLLHVYADKRAYAGHARQYRRMGEMFERAYSHLGAQSMRGDPPQVVRRLVLELGKEALAEHADWVLLHRDRPLEPPRVEL